jgi:CheY-like chemotaxis protein
VYTASDARQALQCVEEHRPNIILLDVGMPDGYELARRIRARPWGTGKSLVAMMRKPL